MQIQKNKLNRLPITRIPREDRITIEPEPVTEPEHQSDKSKVKIKCYLCGYEWECESKTEKITCAGCVKKILREKALVRSE